MQCLLSLAAAVCLFLCQLFPSVTVASGCLLDIASKWVDMCLFVSQGLLLVSTRMLKPSRACLVWDWASWKSVRNTTTSSISQHDDVACTARYTLLCAALLSC